MSRVNSESFFTELLYNTRRPRHHFRDRPKQPRARKRKVSASLVVISLVGTFFGKSLKLLPPDATF